MEHQIYKCQSNNLMCKLAQMIPTPQPYMRFKKKSWLSQGRLNVARPSLLYLASCLTIISPFCCAATANHAFIVKFTLQIIFFPKVLWLPDPFLHLSTHGGHNALSFNDAMLLLHNVKYQTSEFQIGFDPNIFIMLSFHCI